jgi:hypothetical protein
MEAAADNPTFYADLTNPQSLNKYQYAYNNPLRFTDPTGHCIRHPVADVLCRLAATPPAQAAAQKLDQAARVAAATTLAIWAAVSTSNPAATPMDDCRACRDNARFGPYGDQRVDRQNIRNQDNSGNQGGNDKTAPPVQNNSQSSAGGADPGGGPRRTQHGEQRRREGRSGADPRRDVGDPNRVIREAEQSGRVYTDIRSEATVYVGRKGRVVIMGQSGEVTRHTYTKKAIQAKLRDGIWEQQ